MDVECISAEQKERLIVKDIMLNTSQRFVNVFLIFLVGSTLFFGVKTTKTYVIAPENPGYAEQFLLMKQNEKGNIPKGLWREWVKETPKYHGKTGFFKSVDEIGPTNVGGRTISMVIDSKDPNHFITGGATGGIWNSYDAGATWSPSNDLAPNLAISSITQSPFNPNEIYYATGGRPKQSGGTLYSGDGLFKSNDGGKTFQYMDSSGIAAFDNSWDIVHSLTDSNTLYIGTLAHGLYRTQDKGLTFTQIYNTGGSDVYDVDVTKEGRVYFSVYSKGIYYFDEAETPLIQQFSIGASGFHRCEVEPSPSSPNVIYAAFAVYKSGDEDEIEGIYRSNDGGDSWTKLRDPSSLNRHFDQNWFNFILGVHPTNPNFVVVGGVECSYSSNGGNSWSVIRKGHVDYHGVTFTPNSNTFYMLNDGGVYRYSTTSAGSIVSDRNNKLNITQVYSGSFFPTGTKVLIGNQDNNTYINTAGNSVFQYQFGGDGAFTAVSQDGEVMYGSSQFGNIRRNAGSGWTNTPYNRLVSVVGSQDFWFINPFEINPIDGDQVYFPTKNYLARTTNQGNSWTRITDLISGSAYCVAMTAADNPTLYYGGQSGILYRINNAKTATPGNSFKMFTLAPVLARGGFISCIKVDPNVESTIYTAYSNVTTRSNIWKIINADTDSPEWIDISGNLPTSLPVNWVEVDPDNSNHIFAGTDFGLYVTADGGRFWHKEEQFPNAFISMLRLRASDRKLFVFTFGRGVWTADLNEEIITSSRNVKEEKSFTVYPNPTQNFVTLKDYTPSNTVKLYTNTGQVMQVSNTNGRFDLSELENGVYFLVSIDKDGNRSVAKVIKD